MTVFDWSIAYFATLLLSFGKGSFGGAGLGMLAIPLMLFACPADQVLAIMLPVLICCDAWCVLYYRKEWNTQIVALLIGGFVVGTALAVGLFVITEQREAWLKFLIAFLAITFGLYNLFAKGVDREFFKARWFGAAAGAFAGFVSTLSHGAGPVAAMYLLAQRMEKKHYMGTLSLYALIGNSLKQVAYVVLGGVMPSKAITTPETLRVSGLLIVVVPIGVGLGYALNKRVPKGMFPKIISCLLVLAGVLIVVKSI